MSRLRTLFPTFANPDLWRGPPSPGWERFAHAGNWQGLRKKTLNRDNYTCQYRGFRCDKYMIVHHLDHNPVNNETENLVVVCPMCNLIVHSRIGCIDLGVVDLYRRSKYDQNDIIRTTREMRDKGKKDKDMINLLGLRCKVPFRMDRSYLRKLFGFVTSRPTNTSNNIYSEWKTYHAQCMETQKTESSALQH